jgi:hypothetical protein
MRAFAVTLVLTLNTALAWGDGDQTRKRVTLEWNMRLAGNVLVVDYTIVNKLDRWLEVVDSLTTKGTELPDRLIVGPEELLHPEGHPRRSRVAFAKVAWRPTFSEGDEEPVKLTHLRPGESRHWTARVPLPLVGWGPKQGADELQGDEHSAVLLIRYSLRDENKSHRRIPRGCDDLFIVGKELELPPGVTIAKRPKN